MPPSLRRDTTRIGAPKRPLKRFKSAFKSSTLAVCSFFLILSTITPLQAQQCVTGTGAASTACGLNAPRHLLFLTRMAGTSSDPTALSKS